MNNQQIIVSKYMGFCSGVAKAIDMAIKTRQSTHKAVYCLGDIVNNRYVIDKLANNGIVTVDSVDNIAPDSYVIVRAHGVSKDTLDKLALMNVTVVDATCPFVKSIQNNASKYYKEGYQIVLIGNAKHPEIIGVNGWCDNTAIVMDNEQIDLTKHEKVLVMVQTTYNLQKYEKNLQNISSQGVKTLVIINTICYTTVDRQNYAHFVAKQSDIVVVIGDSNSSNTQKLFDIAKQHCNNVLLVSDNNAIDVDLSIYPKIGFISGASTPSELIEGVIGLMTKNANDAQQKVAGSELFQQTIEAMPENMRLRPGQKIFVKVVSIDEDGLVVRLANWKQDAYIPNDEITIDGDFAKFKSELSIGATVECIIKTIEKSKVTLSHKDIEERYKDDQLVEGVRNGEPFEIKVVRVGKDCLIGKLGSYTIIVHASQVKLGFVNKLEPYIGKTLKVVSSAEKVDDVKRTISASAKTLLLAEKKEKEDNFWNNIELNEIIEGKVVRFANFGAFVNVRGFDCLAHTSDLSWSRIEHPSEVLELNNTYEFAVLDLNREKNRVSLGYKQLQPKPWELAAEKYVPGTVVTGKVARIMEFGAFIELEKNIDGLVHISNISWEWLEDINNAFKVGDMVEVEVLEFDIDNKRITLSRKACMPKPDNADNGAE